MRKRNLIALSLLAPGACVRGGDAPPEATAGAAEAALTTDAPACLPGAVDWAQNAGDDRCSGAWQYKQYASCENPTCAGPKWCPEDHWSSCRDWSFGLDPLPTETTYSATYATPKVCHQVCDEGRVAARGPQCPPHEPCEPPDPPEPPSCHVECYHSPEQAAQLCLDKQSAKVAEVRAQTPDQHDLLVQPVSGSLQVTPAGLNMTNCSYRVRAPQPVLRPDELCGCAEELVGGPCVASVCGEDPPRWTAPGLTQAEALAAMPAHAPGTERCSTCEDLPLPAAGDPLAADKARQKYLCLSQLYAEAGAAERGPIARAKELLYEFRGEGLDAAQRADARATYQAHPDAVADCGEPATLPPSPAACPAGVLDPHRGDLARCQRLLASHASAEVASYEAAGCAELLAAYARIPAERGAEVDAACEAGALRGLARATASAVHEKQTAAIVSAPTTLGAVARQLYLLDRLYEADRAALALAHPGEAEPAELSGDLSRAEAAFWGKLGARSGVEAAAQAAILAGDQAALDQALQQARLQGDAIGREVIAAAFTPVATLQPDGVSLGRVPARGAPLLAVLGDAFGPVSRRLDDLGVYHDFGCLFRECRAPTAPTPVLGAYRLVANVGGAGGASDPTSLAYALAQAGSALGGWKATFATLQAQRAALDEALAEAAGPAGPEALADPAALPASARPLARGLLSARGRVDRFAATGQFAPGARTIDSGQDQDTREAIAATLNQQVNTLRARADQYHTGLVAFTQNLLASGQEDAAEQRLRNLREQKALEHEAIEADLRGLYASADAEERALGDVVDAFRQIEGTIDQNAFIAVGDSTPPFFPSGADARYMGTLDLNALSIYGAPLPVAKGQLLSVEVSGQWTPTCSLRMRKALEPQPSTQEFTMPLPIDVADAVTGPEGYTVQWSNGAHRAVSATKARTTALEAGVRGEVCATTGLIGKVSGFEAKACAYAQASLQKTWNTSTSSGSERSTSAALSAGMRLRDTPFPQLPAGALVAVVRRASNNKVIDLQVAHAPSTAIVPEEDANVVFVLNDHACVGSNSPHSDERLTARARTLTPVGQLAPKVVDAMAEVFTQVRGFEPTYRAQGRVLPTQLSFLRSQAVLKLDQKLAPLGIGSAALGSTAPALLNLFNAFLDRELVRIERAVEAYGLERRAELALLELAAIDDDLAAGGDRAKTRELLAGYALRNVDGVLLRDGATDLLAKTRDYLLPVLELWYPAHLAAKKADAAFVARLNALTAGATVDATALGLADEATRAVESLLEAFPAAKFGNKPAGASLPLIMVSFPKPSAANPNPFEPPFESPWRTADAVRAKRLWDAIGARRPAPVTITPADVYTASSGQGTLPCTEAVPVVKALKFFFASTNGAAYPNASTLNNLPRWLGGAAPDAQIFLTEKGEQHYRLAEGSVYKGFQGRVMYGYSPDAESWFNQTSTFTRPLGLSPFGTFEVDFRDLEANWGSQLGLDEAQELVVVMQIDSKAVSPTTPPSGVAACAP